MTPQWDQLPEETPKAFHAFCIYRDLGPERSLEAVRTALGMEALREQTDPATGILFLDDLKLIAQAPSEANDTDARDGESSASHRTPQKNTKRTVERMSSRFHWVARSRAWDGYLDRYRQLAQVGEVERMAKRHSQQNEVGLAGLFEFVKIVLAKLKDANAQKSNEDLGDLSKIFVRCIRSVAAMQTSERVSRGCQIGVDKEVGSVAGGQTIITVETVQPPREKPIDIEALLLETIETDTFGRDAPDPNRPDDSDFTDFDYDGTPRG